MVLIMKKGTILCGVLFLLFSCGGDIKDQGESLGSIIGIVADKTTGDPVGTVNLTLSPGGKKTVTGSDGSFMFSDLSSGSYTIDLDKDGYKRESYSVVVFEGKQTESHLLIDRIPAIITADREVLEFGDNAGVCNKQTFFVLFFVKLFVHFARQFRGSFVPVYC